MLFTLLPWLLFLAFIACLLALDLGVVHRRAHTVHRREAVLWSAVWIGLAVLFNIGVYVVHGGGPGLEWTTGYLIEKSLSVDNVFLFLLIFSSFHVSAAHQRRVLFWGVVGALLMRGILILAGAALLGAFHAVIYVFGVFLLITGVTFLRAQDEAPALERNRLIRLVRRVLPTTPGYEGQRLFVRRGRTLFVTPLFLVLLLIESTDLIFALDSIPAIYGVTEDPFIVFTSNVFAMMGLRALYFVISGYLAGLVFLRPALAAILVFVGAKMLLSGVYVVPALASLAVIVVILAAAIAASLLVRLAGPQPRRTPERTPIGVTPDTSGKSG